MTLIAAELALASYHRSRIRSTVVFCIWVVLPEAEIPKLFHQIRRSSHSTREGKEKLA